MEGNDPSTGRQDLESQILKECFYAFQGISGDCIKFPASDAPLTAKVVISPFLHSHIRSELGSGAMDAISLCAEAGWLFNRIQILIDRIRCQPTTGSIPRAFSNALFDEVQHYRTFLTNLESRVGSSSLRILLVDIQTPLYRLKDVALLADGIGYLPGPQVLQALYRSARHGDRRHQQIVHGLLKKTCKPWFDMLYMWVTEGTLSDPTQEFFVREQSGELWTEQYQLDHSKIPNGILESDLILPSFTIGKGINFIRRRLLDGGWNLKLNRSKDELGFEYSSERVSRIRSTLHEGARLVHSHILSSLHKQYSLFQHLFALKQFLLLGQGDFYASLMNSIHEHITEGGVFRHTLASLVETSLRNTNASEFPRDVLSRLQVDVVKSDAEDGSIWDTLILRYQVPDPLSVIVTPFANQEYEMLFRFLFGLRKVEFLLNSTWRQSAVLQHALQSAAQHNGLTVSNSSGYAQAIVLLRHVSMTRQAMMHFVVNLKSYLMFEVLEGGWKKLVKMLQDAETLDQAIEAHQVYLEGICRKSFVHGDSIGNQVSALLLLVNEFCTYQQHVFGDSLKAAEIAAEKRREAELRLKKGEWGFNSSDGDDDDIFYGLSKKKNG